MALKFKFSVLAMGLVVSAAFAQSNDVIIKNAHIEIGDGKSIEHGVIAIHAGKIVAVGPDLPIPNDVEVVDGKGLFVYPGFIDAYSTQGLKLPDAPSAGTPPDTRNTAPATMWHANRKGIRSDVLSSKCLDLSDRLKDCWSMGITTGLLTSGTGSIRGVATVVDYLDAGKVLVPQAGVEIALKGGFGGGGGGGYPGTLFGVTALVRQILADATSYNTTPPAKKDATLENLKPLVTGQIPALFVADTARELVRMDRLAGEFGMKYLIVGGREGYRELELLKSKKTPVILSVDVSEAPSKKAETGLDALPQAVLDDRYDIWLEKSKNPQALSDAGIPIAFSVGSGFGDYLKGVRKLVQQGLSKEAALKGMTSGAASILGIGDQTGTIETGKLANLTILSGDFTNEKSTVQMVFVEGKKIDMKKGGAK